MALSISVPCRPAQGIPGFHSLAPGASVCYPGVSTTTLWTKQFSNDSKLEFTCGPEASLGAISLLHPAYQLWYTNPRGERNRVAMCLFSGGDNDGYYTSVDNANGQSCLVSTHFENIDGGSKDAPKDVNGFVFTTTDAPGQPHIDELVYDYDANAEKLSWKDLKFNYPPGKTSLDNNAEIITYVTNATPIPGLGHTEDPPIGSLTEGLFTGLMALLLNEPSVPMYKFASCDVNLDGVCDATDFSLFRAAMGACVGRANYQERADMDRDGCVTLKDYQTWYEAYQNGK